VQPVFVYIHGGGFIFGSTHEFSHESILKSMVSRGVIVVMVQYRLGPLGLCSARWLTHVCLVGFAITPASREHARGNAGVEDCVLALRWVRRNIHKFGGDRDRVTLGGHSAGGIMSSLLELATGTNGRSSDKACTLCIELFTRTIPMSGTAMSPIVDYSPRSNERSTLLIAKHTGCDVPSGVQMMNCLQSIDVRRLIDAYRQLVPAHSCTHRLDYNYSRPANCPIKR
jgi:carboxylesterase type B